MGYKAKQRGGGTELTFLTGGKEFYERVRAYIHTIYITMSKKVSEH